MTIFDSIRWLVDLKDKESLDKIPMEILVPWIDDVHENYCNRVNTSYGRCENKDITLAISRWANSSNDFIKSDVELYSSWLRKRILEYND